MAVPLSSSERTQLQQWVAAHGTPQQVALHCQIVLAADDGESDVAIAERLSVNRKTVILWRQRFCEQRLDALWEIAPGRGRKPTYDINKITAIVEATLQTKPKGMTHWSCRTMAKSQGVSKSTINNIWQAHNLKPHRAETFKLSRDKKFLEKMTDVVVLHFVPTSASWLNLVERWFGVLDDKAIRRGVFRSVEDLKAAIEAFLTVWNQDPQPFVWTATVESITEKLSRCRQTLEKIQPGCTSTRTKKRKN
jgi:hypothetical protein